MNEIIQLESQLPKPQLNTRAFKQHLADNGFPVKLEINDVKLANEKPMTKPRTADVVLSCKILTDVDNMPLYELTSNGDIITNDSPIIQSSTVSRDNAIGLNVNLSFPVKCGIIPMGQPGIYVNNTMEFYDILNYVLSNKELIPNDNDKEIRLNINSMYRLLQGSIFSIKGVYSNSNVYLKLVGGVNGDME